MVVQPQDCYERSRLEILTGAESPYIEPDADQVNSAFNRLTQLLRHEHTLHPDEGWAAYFTASTTDPLRWDRIVFAGHSQGGGHAAMTARLHTVPRVLLFGATEPAEWTSTAVATPPA
jgi:pimeloyl-ACP methyl ester carboxylesterase